MLFLRALIAFLILPTTIAGLIPFLLLPADHWRLAGARSGWVLLVFGLSVLLWCVRDFYVLGKGSLSPWDPPRKLVVLGLYRFVRNPMYIGVLGITAGWSLLTGSLVLAAYTGVLGFGFHLRVLLYEEPTLARTFSTEWERYCDHINRWWPRLPAASRTQFRS